MSSPAIALPPAPPAKAPKKKAKTQRKAGPTLSKLILKAVAASKGRGGLSLVGLKKALKAGGYDVVKNRARIVLAIKRLVANKSLVRTKGSGASGSFKLNKKAPKPRKRVLKKKKSKAKKTKKAKAKKTGASPAKKSPKKKKTKKAKTPKKTKAPRKAKKPAAAKKTAKPKSPKRPKRRVARATKTAAAAKK